MIKTVWQRFAVFLTAAVLVLCTVCPVLGASHSEELSLACRVDYLLRLNDEAVLVDHNADLQAAPASVTKITTALVVLQNCPDLQKTVTVTASALASLEGTNSSLSAIQPGEQLTVENMLRCMMIPSGNDAAAVLAEYVGGTEEAFVKMMNECVSSLGCTGTHYDNPHGLDSPTHYTTAKDIVKIARAAMEYDIFREIVSTHLYTLPATNLQPERTLESTNDLTDPDSRFYRSYAHGIKTGHTDEAGYCLVSFAEQDGTEYISVAMGGNYYDYNEAFSDSVHMLDWAFTHYIYTTVCTQGQPAFAVPVRYGTDTDSVSLVFAETAAAYLYDEDVRQGISVAAGSVPQTLTAPLTEGTAVGSVQIFCGGELLASPEVCAAQSVRFDKWAYIKDGHYDGILLTAACIGFVCVGLVLLLVCIVLKKKSGRTEKVEE